MSLQDTNLSRWRVLYEASTGDVRISLHCLRKKASIKLAEANKELMREARSKSEMIDF